MRLCSCRVGLCGGAVRGGARARGALLSSGQRCLPTLERTLPRGVGRVHDWVGAGCGGGGSLHAPMARRASQFSDLHAQVLIFNVPYRQACGEYFKKMAYALDPRCHVTDCIYFYGIVF